ncbi:hypothetical protein DXA96_19290 [Lachnospiraceae bacterium OF09-33XD]|nr:hypothetical protein DXA96_19290 [Lachnospiraceae bacterium OF09-33XD]
MGRKFEYSLISNNELRIYDGEGIMQGVHYRILPGTYESVVLENGTQGNKRIDLIVARYEKNAETGIESVEVAVKKGAETTEIPVEPTAMIGDIRKGATLHEMPLYSVEYNGITVKEIVSRFTEIADLRMVREEIDRLNSNLGGLISTEQRTVTFTSDWCHINDKNGYILLNVFAVQDGTNNYVKSIQRVSYGGYTVIANVNSGQYVLWLVWGKAM